jgi:RNA polymerase sigma-32 factor
MATENELEAKELEAKEPEAKEPEAETLKPELIGADRDEPDKTRAKVPAVRQKKAAARTRGGGDLLSHYLTEVRRYPILDAAEERELAIRYQETGDPEAAERLVTSNLRLVVKLAFQYHRQWNSVLDLVQEGNVGLVEALSRFDPYRGIRFSSYAQYWIRAMILRFLMDNFRMVRLGSTRAGRKLFFQLQKERDRLVKEGLDVSTKLLAERLDVKESEVIAVDRHMRAPALSIDSPVGDPSEGRALSDMISDDETQGPEERAANSELGGQVRTFLDEFRAGLTDEREKAIWDERLLSADPLPLSALGTRFGVSKERIRQIEARMRRKLKVHLKDRMPGDVDLEIQLPSGER